MGLVRKIMTESIKVVILASVLSTIGGIGVEALKVKIALFVPMIVMLPALNDMIGDFGTIISSKFTTLLFLGKIKDDWWNSKELGDMFKVVAYIAIVSAVYLGTLSNVIAYFKGFAFDWIIALKVLSVALMATASLVMIIFVVAIIGGLIVYKKGTDPDNFLAPITTSIADLGSMLLFAFLIRFLF